MIVIHFFFKQNEDVHIAAAPLQITNERQSAVPFTKPFRHIGHRIIIKRPVVEFHSLKVLFEPFALQLWIMVVVICFIVSALLFIVNKFSPSEWGSVQPEDDSTNARESFAPKNAFFFVHSTLTWQGMIQLVHFQELLGDIYDIIIPLKLETKKTIFFLHFKQQLREMLWAAVNLYYKVPCHKRRVLIEFMSSDPTCLGIEAKKCGQKQAQLS